MSSASAPSKICAWRLPDYVGPQPVDPRVYRGCEFGVSSARLLAVDEQWFCPYHAPCVDARNERTVKANWPDDERAAFYEGLLSFINKTSDARVYAEVQGVVFPWDVDFGPDGNLPLPQKQCIGFACSQFHGVVRMHGSEFHGAIDFSYCIFSSVLQADECTFESELRLAGAEIGDSLFLQRAKCRGLVDCTEITTRNLYASDTQFEDAVWLHKATISRSLGLSGAKFDSALHLSEASVRGAALDGVTVRGSASFGGTQFQKMPLFHNACLPEHATFEGVQVGACDSTEDLASARLIRQHALKQGDFRTAASFHALELATRRKAAPLYREVLNRLYWLGSSYGRSCVRPVLGLLLVTASAFLTYLAAGSFESVRPATEWVGWHRSLLNDAGGLSQAKCAAAFAIQQALPSALVSRSLPFAAAEWWMMAVGFVQLTMTTTLVALFVLALRRRFRFG